MSGSTDTQPEASRFRNLPFSTERGDEVWAERCTLQQTSESPEVDASVRDHARQLLYNMDSNLNKLERQHHDCQADPDGRMHTEVGACYVGTCWQPDDHADIIRLQFDRLGDLQVMIRRMRTSFHKYKADLRQLQVSHKLAVDGRDDQIEKLKAQLLGQEHDIRARDDKLQGLSDQLENLQSVIAARDDEIQSLRQNASGNAPAEERIIKPEQIDSMSPPLFDDPRGHLKQELQQLTRVLETLDRSSKTYEQALMRLKELSKAAFSFHECSRDLARLLGLRVGKQGFRALGPRE